VCQFFGPPCSFCCHIAGPITYRPCTKIQRLIGPKVLDDRVCERLKGSGETADGRESRCQRRRTSAEWRSSSDSCVSTRHTASRRKSSDCARTTEAGVRRSRCTGVISVDDAATAAGDVGSGAAEKGSRPSSRYKDAVLGERTEIRTLRRPIESALRIASFPFNFL